MNPKSLAILVAVTALVVVAAFLSLDRDARGDGNASAAGRADAPAVLFPELGAEVNDAAEVTVSKDEQTATLAREGETWVCREASGYPADFEKVRSGLIALARLEVLEPMTRDPAQHAKLGVDAEGGTHVVLRDGAGEVLADLVVGETQYARTGQQVYARRTGEDQAWRCEGELALSADPLTWVDRNVLQLASSRPSRIEITHADGETVAATRAYPAAQTWDVVGLPPDRVLNTPGIANGMGTALSYLQFDEVRPADELALGEHHAAIARYETYGGLQIEVRVASIDEQSWITVDVDYEAPPEPVGPEVPDEEGEDGDAAEPADAPPEPPDAERRKELAAEAAELDAHLEGWAYRIPKFKADPFLRRMEDLLAAPPEVEPVEPPTSADEPGAAMPEQEPGDAGTMQDDGTAPEEGGGPTGDGTSSDDAGGASNPAGKAASSADGAAEEAGAPGGEEGDADADVPGSSDEGGAGSPPSAGEGDGDDGGVVDGAQEQDAHERT
jgi:hypothetical protein